MRIIMMALGACLIWLTPAWAENHTYLGCDLSPDEYNEILLPILTGDWQTLPGAGTMLISNGGTQTALPVPAEEQGAATLTGGDGYLFVEEKGAAGLYKTTLTTAEELGDYGLSDAVMDFDALGDEVPNCMSNLLPIITYKGELSANGAPASFEVILHVISADLMSGILIMNVSDPQSGQLHLRRFITFKR